MFVYPTLAAKTKTPRGWGTHIWVSEQDASLALRNEFVCLLGESEVFFGDAAGVVGGEAEGDAGVANVDVGVVLGCFGEQGEVVDEINAGEEVVEFVGAGELVVDEAPAVEGFKVLLNFIRG